MRTHAFTNTVIAAARFETADETIKKRAIDDRPYELTEVPTKAVPYKAAAGALKSGSFPVFSAGAIPGTCNYVQAQPQFAIKRGWSCLPARADSTVGAISEKSDAIEKGFLTGSSCRNGTK